MTCTVGKIRTSTGSISVIKISQKKSVRSGKRNQTSAKAESIDTVILPTVMPNAMIRLFSSIRLKAGPLPLTPWVQMRETFSHR